MSDLKPLTKAETTELLDWVSACQSSYHIDSTPNHRFGGLGSHLQENRDSLVEYVNELIAARAQPAITSESGNQAAQGASAITSESVPLLTEDELWDLWNAQGCDDMNHVEASAFARAIESLVRSKLGAGVGWQPIETAPKDRTEVLLYGIWAGEIHGAASKPTTDIGSWNGGKSDLPGDDWWCLSTGDAYACWMRPTHWMPLPPPPGIVGKEGGK